MQFSLLRGCSRGQQLSLRTCTSGVNRAQRAVPFHAVNATSSVTTPHSGYHFDGSPRRFFEGWYWRVFDPATGESFALIYSIEDPLNNTAISGVGAQVMGPGDGYLAQYSKDLGSFWANTDELQLGACFKTKAGRNLSSRPKRIIAKKEFVQTVDQGFQASMRLHQGSLVAQEQGAQGAPFSTEQSCSWCFEVEPVYGWGNVLTSQQATAGWLSILSVFEPHWQVLMAHGLASGWFQWGDKRFEFSGAPTYAEKNWGGGFPSKWIWVQCNTFQEEALLSVTAVGARRSLVVGVPGVEEDVGMIGIHYKGQFIELVPWNGHVEWEADVWGRWHIEARNDKYEAVLEASCSAEAGTVLRAPTATQGLAPFCKDTFAGTCRLTVWEVNEQGRRSAVPLVDAQSTSAALEVGGGPWWSSWQAAADMKEPFRSMVQLPIDVTAIGKLLPGPLKPPGL